MIVLMALGDIDARMAYAASHVSVVPLGARTTERVFADWSAAKPLLTNFPDRSFRTVWVRMFPLVSAPEADPYPNTKNVDVIDIENRAGLQIFDLASGAAIGRTPSLHLDFRSGTFLLGTTHVRLAPIYVVANSGTLTLLEWDKGSRAASGKRLDVGVQVRGDLVIQPTDFAPQISRPLWSVINVLSVDDYLKSVVPSEAIASWAPEALGAQAIASRSYGVYQMGVARQIGQEWDVDPSTEYQSYRGASFRSAATGTWTTLEQGATTAAVAATSNEIVTYDAEVIQAFFSANSGGVTCTASECFQTPDLPYLKQKPDAPGIEGVGGGTWGQAADITPQSITGVLKTLGLPPASPVVELQPLRRGPSGRIWQLRVKLETGSIDLDMDQTKKMMSLFGAIRSYLYTLNTTQSPPARQPVVGHGYGHGVGMSQWGAELFAEQGWSTARILDYYYDGTALSKPQ